jgi:2,3-bisphosphoglycerate-dependent phosphoglycerate mutase
VFCSDLARAVETAQIAFGGRGLPIFHDWRLRECNYGMLNGTAIARLEVERTRHVVDPYSGGESYTDVVARARSFLHDLPGRYADTRIIVIGHSATKWAFDHILEGIPLDELVEGSFRWQPGWLYTLAVDA